MDSEYCLLLNFFLLSIFRITVKPREKSRACLQKYCGLAAAEVRAEVSEAHLLYAASPQPTDSGFLLVLGYEAEKHTLPERLKDSLWTNAGRVECLPAPVLILQQRLSGQTHRAHMDSSLAAGCLLETVKEQYSHLCAAENKCQR